MVSEGQFPAGAAAGALKQTRRDLCNFSFAPSGLVHLARPTHGFRRGLQSFAASRLLPQFRVLN